MPVTAPSTSTSTPINHSTSSSSTANQTQILQKENKLWCGKGSVLGHLAGLKGADSKIAKKYTNILADTLTSEQASIIGLDSKKPGNFGFNKFNAETLDEKALKAADDNALRTAIELSLMTNGMSKADLDNNYSNLLKEAEVKVANQKCLNDLIRTMNQQGLIMKRFERTGSNDPLAEAITESVIRSDLSERDRQPAAEAYKKALMETYKKSFSKKSKIPNIQDLATLINTVSALPGHQNSVKQNVKVRRFKIKDGKLEDVESNNSSENPIHLLRRGDGHWGTFIPRPAEREN